MKKLSLVLPALLFTSVSVMAGESLSYTSIEADYVNMDIDGYDDHSNFLRDLNDGGGWGLSGMFEFSPNWFVFANYSSVQADADFVDNVNQSFNADTDIKRFDFGAGYYLPLNEQADWVFRVAYSDIDVGNFDFGGSSSSSLSDLGDDTSDGFFVDASLRGQMVEWLEGSVGARYTNIEKVDNFSLIGNVLFEISPEVGFNVGAEIGDELTTYLAGVRVSF